MPYPRLRSTTPPRPLSRRLLASAIALPLAAFAALAYASDHQEAGTISGADPAADIGDLYVWHDQGRVNAVLTFAGYRLRTEAPVYDADVLYQIHFDVDGDNLADEIVEARFGQNSAGDWGVRIDGLPGSSAPLVGAVDETLEDGAARAVGGQFDDPFFFDLQGFQDTLSTGTLSFDASRDFVALKNTSAVVVSFEASALGSESFSAWATTGRL